MDITLHIPTLKEALAFWKAALLLAVLTAMLVLPAAEQADATGGGHSIVTLDSAGDVGS